MSRKARQRGHERALRISEAGADNRIDVFRSAAPVNGAAMASFCLGQQDAFTLLVVGLAHLALDIIGELKNGSDAQKVRF
ncbi:hypothetical protein N789_10695 [Arenimonas oryziterrae DSM 21050 = YC6267]|uniref:Uncharacterized protein n=1 Tax=Arenimonas oryziterrae DSM 21050 = YC6267 TaxID=1121015 RepID=A0A091AUF3_9GAMM|nr:hypothetical protein N789_10695 [Arenimonas oryziterrae DSM 21050 = YC6267]